jgi:hypothetical protein
MQSGSNILYQSCTDQCRGQECVRIEKLPSRAIQGLSTTACEFVRPAMFRRIDGSFFSALQHVASRLISQKYLAGWGHRHTLAYAKEITVSPTGYDS